MESSHIRNFCIIAHIDHGKSTLADRFLEVTGTMEKREMKHGQLLDTMDLEQERGITIKLQPVRMHYKGFQMNLIDTPGHVDFSYEVSRSLAAVEGAILVVDASQGIQAQTLANVYLAQQHNLTIIPVLNKIDLPAADPERVAQEIENMLCIPKEEIIKVSAKDGTNVDLLLDAVIERIPAPKQDVENKDTRALIFDSVFDPYRGVVTYLRVKEGEIKKGDTVYFLNADRKLEVLEVGYFKPKYVQAPSLKSGEIGYLVTGLKSTSDARVGDTVWKSALGRTPEQINPERIPGYAKVTPFVFAGIFCVEAEDYPLLRDSLAKLALSDSSLVYEPETSQALGHGYRCGFLGLLHMDIVQERLEREYNLDLLFTAPSVSFKIKLLSLKEVTEQQLDENGLLTVSNPADLPKPEHAEDILEPYVRVEIITPKDHMGGIMKLLNDRRGNQLHLEYIDEDRVILDYEIPLLEIVLDFYDKLKSISSGYASMSYEFIDYRSGDLVKLDVLVAGEKIDALSTIVHRSNAQRVGSDLCASLKDIIPRALFPIAIQAAIGAKVIARETISALRKDVTAKLYGGDISRKMKLLKKQKEGKKRMKQFGKVTIPQEAFLAILKQGSAGGDKSE